MVSSIAVMGFAQNILLLLLLGVSLPLPTRAVSCSTVIVDATSGEGKNCSELSWSLANLTCNSLEDVLMIISHNYVSPIY